MHTGASCMLLSAKFKTMITEVRDSQSMKRVNSYFKSPVILLSLH